MTQTALEWEGVHFSVRQGFWLKSQRILHDINIAVPEGTVLGLVGPNGAGKTTTIKLGAGLLRPESGQVRIFGQPVSEASHRKPLGLLTESQYIYPHLRLQEWLIMLAGFSGLTAERCAQQAEEVMALLDLSDRADQMMRSFSKGQLQRAGLAQALIHQPRVLLLDEPMSGLDPYWRYRLQKVLLDLKEQGVTILFSSHILADVERLCDQVVLLGQGRIRWQGSLSRMPRAIKGYEAVCRTDAPEQLEALAENGKPVRLPEGQWRLSLSEGEKERLLQLAAEGTIHLLALRPLQEEIEEVLFSFNHAGTENQTRELS